MRIFEYRSPATGTICRQTGERPEAGDPEVDRQQGTYSAGRGEQGTRE